MLLSIHLASDSLKQHKARSLLAASGVMLGVFLVSLILIIGDSAKHSLQKQLQSLPDKSILINGNDGSSSFIHKPADTLNNKDLESISKIDDDINLSSSLLINSRLKIEDRTLDNVNVAATSTNYHKIFQLKMLSGSWFSAEDSGKNWVILGYNLAHKLIGTESPKNEVVTIKGQKFTVVGIVDKVHQPLPILGYDINQSAFISLSNGQELTKSNKISQIVATNPHKNISDTRKEIATTLNRKHSDSGEYTMFTTADISNQLTQLISTISIAAAMFAGVVLLTSIIAIANVMLVTVTERRREIGIRKAVGATTHDILSQFLVESLIIALRGGIVGLVFAYLIAFVITFTMSFDIVFSWSAILAGFLLPVIIGTLAGIYPAYRAARGDIITALRQLT